MATEEDIQPIPRHAEYYLDGNTTFLVEGQLFRVHRYFFERESEFFRNYLIPSDECNGTDEKPYSLDVTSEDFAKLLWVWYNPSYHREDQPRDTWLTILTLARRWGFESIIELVIYELEQLEMGATERISVYTEHEIDKRLLIPSYIELCRSPTLPSLTEAAWLPMEILLGLTVARERALCRAAELGSSSPTSAVLEDEDLVAIIVDVFGIESTADDDPQPPNEQGNPARTRARGRASDPPPARGFVAVGSPPKYADVVWGFRPCDPHVLLLHTGVSVVGEGNAVHTSPSSWYPAG
ncbi:hypothetical protein EDC04DRAFT_3006283 [Pisolithus marmoratus]|nr:hypothetical protein EDC04DRAFT_3006283 [Pisolithus marmoratus]